MTYTLEQAQANLAQLLAEAENGQEVVIERDEKPALKIVVVQDNAGIREPQKPRIPGQYAGQFQYSNDWWKPLETDEELREYGFDIMIDDGKPDDLAS
jgi:antitoxin (DNA-binding transcriptional repressor) of toxin-antitoxin stability system